MRLGGVFLGTDIVCPNLGGILIPMKRKLSPEVAGLVRRIARREGIPVAALLRRYFPGEARELAIDNGCQTAYDSGACQIPEEPKTACARRSRSRTT